MLNRIIRFSLDNRWIVIATFALVVVAGLVVASRTNVDVFPDLNAPTVTVMTEAPGLAPDEVEKLVTYPIETAVNGSVGVRRIRSGSETGLSVVTIEFDWGVDVYRARQVVAEKLSTVAETLPPNVESPVMTPQTSIMGEVLILGLTADKTSMMQLRTIADRVIRPQLLSMQGVAQVTVMGGDVKEYRITLDDAKMARFSLSLDDVLSALEKFNANTNGTIIHEYGNEYLVKGDINTADVNEIGNVLVGDLGNQSIRLRDVASVGITAEEPRLGIASVKGKPAVVITVSKQSEVNTVELIDNIEVAMKDIKKSLPSDVVVSTDIFRQSDFIDNSINNIQNSLIEGAIFVVIILFLFLMDIRATIISVVALPVSVIVTLIVLHLFGLSINTMSLGGIAIAIGSLVDDAIVDVENVYRRLRANRLLPECERRSVKDVVYSASSEVRMPILNSTLIIIASFMPLFFLTGIEGRMLIPLGIAFITSLIASTIVALTLTPVLCRALLEKDKNIVNDKREPWLSHKLKSWYEIVLRKCLKYRKRVLYPIAALFIIALGLFFTLGRSFLPSFNEGSFTINVTALPGISIEESDKIGQMVDKALLSIPEIKTIARKTGRAELDEHSRGSNSSEIEAPYTIIDRSREEIMAEIRKKLAVIPGISVEIGQPISHRIDAMLSGTKAQVAIKIFGDELSTLHDLATKVKGEISQIDGVVDINVEQQVERPEIVIKPNRTLLAEEGITMPQFKNRVDVATSGIIVSNVYEDGVPYNLRLKSTNISNSKISDLNNMQIDGKNGKLPLSYVSDIKSVTTYNSINRENARRRIVVSANIQGRDLVGAVNEIREKIEHDVKLPQGYYVNYGGQFESEETSSKTLGFASIFALVVIFFLLYHQFKNFIEAFVILVNIPLAIIGGVIILCLSGGEINIPAIIGFISLLGIATRNGMLLISHYRQLESRGSNSMIDYIVIGSRDRLLPILMTALSSALALIPIVARGGQPGNEIQSPMALVILGGLFTSTFLNIFVVPVIYYIYKSKYLSNE